MRRVVASRASCQKVRRTCVHGRVLEARVMAALNGALPSNVCLTLRLRGFLAAQYVGALHSERMELLFGEHGRHADSHGGALQDCDVAALCHCGERYVVLTRLACKALGEVLVGRVGVLSYCRRDVHDRAQLRVSVRNDAHEHRLLHVSR